MRTTSEGGGGGGFGWKVMGARFFLVKGDRGGDGGCLAARLHAFLTDVRRVHDSSSYLL